MKYTKNIIKYGSLFGIFYINSKNFNHRFSFQNNDLFNFNDNLRNENFPKHSIINDNKVWVFAGNNTSEEVNNICKLLGLPNSDLKISKFRDGEICLQTKEKLNGKKAIIVHSLSNKVNDNIVELLLMIDMLKRNGCESVEVILNYTSYSRMDRPVFDYKSISASAICNLISKSGANSVVTIDIHSLQFLGFFPPTTSSHNLSATKLGSEFYKNLNIDFNNLVLVSPDAGGINRCKEFGSYFNNNNIDYSFIIKQRNSQNNIEDMKLIGDVKNKDCIIIDDLIDSGSTLLNAAKNLKSNGANNIYVFATHGIFNNNFDEKLNNSEIKKVVVTNSIKKENLKSEKIEYIKWEPLIADYIFNKYN